MGNKGIEGYAFCILLPYADKIERRRQMILKQGLVLLFEEGGFVQRDIRVENGVIAEIAPEIAPKADEEIFDAAGKYITPVSLTPTATSASVKRAWAASAMTATTIPAP